MLNFNVKFIRRIVTPSLQLNEMMFYSTVEFKDLQIENGEQIATKNQNIKNSASEGREFVVSIGMNQ